MESIFTREGNNFNMECGGFFSRDGRILQVDFYWAEQVYYAEIYSPPGGFFWNGETLPLRRFGLYFVKSNKKQSWSPSIMKE